MVEQAPAGEGRWLCPATALADGGRAHVFDLLQYGRPVRAFALRHGGRVVAYLNRCLHVPVEMDWQPGEFLDAERRHIVCSIHGATYDPADGRCVAGPCRGGRLTAVDVREAGGGVYWYPSPHLLAPAAALAAAPAPRPSS